MLTTLGLQLFIAVVKPKLGLSAYHPRSFSQNKHLPEKGRIESQRLFCDPRMRSTGCLKSIYIQAIYIPGYPPPQRVWKIGIFHYILVVFPATKKADLGGIDTPPSANYHLGLATRMQKKLLQIMFAIFRCCVSLVVIFSQILCQICLIDFIVS